MKTFSLTFLEPGDKVLVVHRRLFEKDSPRYFLGVVEGFNENNGLLKVSGHSTGPSPQGGFAQKRSRATKVLSLTSGALIVYLLDASVNLESAVIEADKAGKIELRDANRQILDLSEAISR